MTLRDDTAIAVHLKIHSFEISLKNQLPKSTRTFQLINTLILH